MKTKKAYFAGGCFWCLEASYKLLPGVTNVTSGYAGGSTQNPTYEQVSSGLTGHTETVEIEFDPRKVSYEELLDLFFVVHDPSQKDRQGADIGTRYRSAIFFVNGEQEKSALDYIDKLRNGKQYAEIYTEVVKLEYFWPAEDYHQNYFAKHPEQAYCQAVIKPKLDKVKKHLKE